MSVPILPVYYSQEQYNYNFKSIEFFSQTITRQDVHSEVYTQNNNSHVTGIAKKGLNNWKYNF